jgi:glycosyltransferase involved in cell wall biosynthesis
VITEHSSEILRGGLSPHRARIARSVYEDAKCVIAVSTALADQISTIAPNADIRVIGNLVRESVFAKRMVLKAPTNALRLISIGSLVDTKRTHFVIQTIARLPLRLKARIIYDIVGDGPERARLVALAESCGVHTVFHGNLPHDETMNLLSSRDLLVHPSAFETFGIVLAEALALGVPVLATRCGGPEDLVGEEDGMLVKVDDADDLLAGMRSILDDVDLWKSRSHEMAQRAFQRFHENHISTAVMEVYL